MHDDEIFLDADSGTRELDRIVDLRPEGAFDGQAQLSPDLYLYDERDVPEVKLDGHLFVGKPCPKLARRPKRGRHGTRCVLSGPTGTAAPVFPIWETEVSIDALNRLARALDELNDDAHRLFG
jgi:hypothetical protein